MTVQVWGVGILEILSSCELLGNLKKKVGKDCEFCEPSDGKSKLNVCFKIETSQGRSPEGGSR